MKYICGLLIFLSPFLSYAEVYKWTDDQGNIHYSDSPRAGDAVKVQIDKAPAPETNNSTSREELRQRVTDSLEEDRLAKKESREKQKQAREKKQKECNWLRDRQRRFSTANGVYTLDKDGNRVFMSDETRRKNEQALQKKIKQACS